MKCSARGSEKRHSIAPSPGRLDVRATEMPHKSGIPADNACSIETGRQRSELMEDT
jgi:hypothetical protein